MRRMLSLLTAGLLCLSLLPMGTLAEEQVSDELAEAEEILFYVTPETNNVDAMEPGETIPETEVEDEIETIDNVPELGDPALDAAGENSGTCGDALTWELSDDGVLTISGEGAMPAYSSDNTAPWYSVRGSVTSIVINEGVSSVGDYAFYDCRYASSVSLPNTLTKIGNCAFGICRGLESITLPDSVVFTSNMQRLTSFYLTKDLDLPMDITVPAGKTVDICLSGFTLTLGGHKLVVQGVVNLYDCQGGGVLDLTNGSLTLDGGTFNVYGGTVIPADAVITEPVNTFVVQYDANGGRGELEHQIKTEGVDLTLSDKEPWRANYIFLGWASDADAAEPEFQPGGTYASDAGVTLYAVWQEDQNQYYSYVDGYIVGNYTNHTDADWIETYINDRAAGGALINFKVRGVSGYVTVEVFKNYVVSHTERVITESSVDHTPGDINGDGFVDGRDVISLAQYFAGYSVTINELNADVTGNGILDGRDLVRMAQYFAGYDVVLI